MSQPFRIPTVPAADVELPEEVSKLYDLAYNLWWTWSPKAWRLFAHIDRWAWEKYRNPVEMLLNVTASDWQSLIASDSFMSEFRDTVADFEDYMGERNGTWYDSQGPQEPIAYFSMEYGLHQSLAIYSGGLGVLSGDHNKSASDLGLPLVAVGLLYRCGYFRQTIDPEGRQQHFYPEYDFSRLPLRLAAGQTRREVRVTVPLADREVTVRVWVAQVGRVPLLLLDTDVPENPTALRPITNNLYVRGREMRLVQETVLGLGGVAALAALGISPGVWHVNEGHCALLQLERLRRLEKDGVGPLREALTELARNTVFTTHTPVPAGNETFDRGLARRYLEPFDGLFGMTTEDLLDLGQSGRVGDDAFNLTALGLRTSGYANAVSRLNAEVTNDMWRHLRRAGDQSEVEIRPITNGVHAPTWVGREMRDVLRRHLGETWQDRLLQEPAVAEVALRELSDATLWRARQAQKERLVHFARSRWREQLARHGCAPAELDGVSDRLDRETLLIGFARRFATYKRARLIFRDLERLRALLWHRERPVTLLFAGKAHPADIPGQRLIEEIFRLGQSPEFRGRVFFLEDYDMRVGQNLVQGTDVWLNTPRRPMEASGTSGQKAAMNGVPNLSILDGWWPEGWDGSNGWAIDSGAVGGSDEENDARDATALYATLEEVAERYYDRTAEGYSPRWLAMVRNSIATVSAQFSSDRMVRDYAVEAYLPALRARIDSPVS
ncbi:MAG: alpha-glucan family phosphorylase [Acidobacteriota bacterium]